LGIELLPVGQFALFSISLAVGGTLMLWWAGKRLIRAQRI
jgi:hypothetical protein